MNRAWLPAVIVVRPHDRLGGEVVEPGVGGDPVQRPLADPVVDRGRRGVVGALDHRPEQVALAAGQRVVADALLAQQRDHEQDLDHARGVVDAVRVRAVHAGRTRRRPRTRSVRRARRRTASPPRPASPTDSEPRPPPGRPQRLRTRGPRASASAHGEPYETGRSGARRASKPMASRAQARRRRRRNVRDLSDTAAPSIGPNTALEKDARGAAGPSEQSDVDAMGLDKRREVIGGRYSASFGRQAITTRSSSWRDRRRHRPQALADDLDQPPSKVADQAPWTGNHHAAGPAAVARQPTSSCAAPSIPSSHSSRLPGSPSTASNGIRQRSPASRRIVNARLGVGELRGRARSRRRAPAPGCRRSPPATARAAGRAAPRAARLPSALPSSQ